MTKKSSARSKRLSAQKSSSPGNNVLLMLTLVPLVIGVLFIGAWALDMSILEDAQSQITVGILFFLFSFAASNALQKRWKLAAGWGLLICADLVLLAWLDLWAQLVAIGFGLVGLIFLASEFYKQYQQGKPNKAQR
jgi:hypothetical protein